MEAELPAGMDPGLRGLTKCDGVPLGIYLLRVAWVVVELTLVIYLGQTGMFFYYQGF